ncbi:tyrosine-type recombinase/integrase [Rothia koreensis]|uniref:tyrosine-type recombinase/integrase n=1 Tax=Rothia koreensis TaxID=592378 RepID=UPI0037C5F770
MTASSGPPQPLGAGETNAQRRRQLLGAWLASLLSPHTRRAYRSDLAGLCRFLDAGNTDLLAATRPILDLYRARLVTTGLSSATIARKLAATSSFYAYAIESGVIEDNPAERVSRPPVDSGVSTTAGLSLGQMKKLLDHARADGPRSWALVAILYYTGARISEIIGADIEDLGHDQGFRTLTITRKGGKRAKLVLPGQVIEALEAYLGTETAHGTAVAAPDRPGTRRPLFRTRTGRGWTSSGAARVIARLGREAGCGRISPHVFRHSHATHALDAGVPLDRLQDSFGHASPATTQRYNRARERLERSSALTIAQL